MKPFPRVFERLQASFGQRISTVRLLGFCCGALVFLWPFLFFRSFLSPNSPVAIDNDFYVLYYVHKAYFLELMAQGHFPLWSPGEGAGFPFYSNPFNQVFYPLNVPLILIYKIFGGYSVFDHQIFSVFGAALFGLGLYFWLGRILPSRRGALFAALVFSISFKIGDILRFPNAIHAAAWIPWILYGIARAREAKNSRETGLILFAACIMQLTAGYPYYSYYCLFLIPPYVVLLLFGKTRDALHFSTKPPPVSNLRFLTTCFLPAAVASLLCLPYYTKMFQLFERTTSRGGKNYGFATAFHFDGMDTLGALIFPPSAQADGWYYFGFTGFFLLVIFGVSIFLNRKRMRSDWLFVVIGLAWFSVISYITYGRISYLFDLLYNWFPGFDSLRVWGRLNIILVPLLALAMGRAFLYFERLVFSRQSGRNGQGRIRLRLLKVLFESAVFFGSIQLLLYNNEKFDPYWIKMFDHLKGTEWRFLAMNLAACLLLAGIVFLSGKRPGLFTSRLAPSALVCLLAVAVFVELSFTGGAKQWIYSNVYSSRKSTPHFAKFIPAAFYIPRIRSYYTLKFPHFNVGVIDTWYFSDYLEFYGRVFDDFSEVKNAELEPYFNKLMGISSPKLLFVSERLDHPTMKDFLADSEHVESSEGLKIEPLHYDGDILKFNLQSNQSVYVSFIDNWDPDWKAYVNGMEVPISKLFGTFKAVAVEPGLNEVRFSYEPFSLWKSAKFRH